MAAVFVILVDLTWFICWDVSLSLSPPCYWSDDKSARKYCNQNCSIGNLASTQTFIYILPLTGNNIDLKNDTGDHDTG